MLCSELAAGYHPLACQYGMYRSVLFCASWESSYRLQHRTQLCWAHGARTSCGVVGREEPEEGNFITTHPAQRVKESHTSSMDVAWSPWIHGAHGRFEVSTRARFLTSMQVSWGPCKIPYHKLSTHATCMEPMHGSNHAPMDDFIHGCMVHSRLHSAARYVSSYRFHTDFIPI